MIRIIQEEEPARSSTRLSTNEALASLAALRQTEPRKLMALLRGELDCVVMKCLEKQRNRRYETANGLARDVQRYLADELVEARPPSVGYQLGKFLKRHKGPVLAAAAVLLALLAGITGTANGLVRAEQGRHAAEQRGPTRTSSAASPRRTKGRPGGEGERRQGGRGGDGGAGGNPAAAGPDREGGRSAGVAVGGHQPAERGEGGAAV